MKKRQFRMLVSVYNKKGLIDFIQKLVDVFALNIVSTGGTAKHLTQSGFRVEKVDTITKHQEILNGRVKTLHPAIFGGILADQKNPKHQKELKKYSIKAFDMVIVNLYPFCQTAQKKGATLDQAIEQIDIGGVSLLRAAAKNFQSVIAVSDPADYQKIVNKLKQKNNLSFAERKQLSTKVFTTTSKYDQHISNYLS